MFKEKEDLLYYFSSNKSVFLYIHKSLNYLPGTHIEASYLELVEEGNKLNYEETANSLLCLSDLGVEGQINRRYRNALITSIINKHIFFDDKI